MPPSALAPNPSASTGPKVALPPKWAATSSEQLQQCWVLMKLACISRDQPFMLWQQQCLPQQDTQPQPVPSKGMMLALLPLGPAHWKLQWGITGCSSTSLYRGADHCWQAAALHSAGSGQLDSGNHQSSQPQGSLLEAQSAVSGWEKALQHHE